MKESNSLVLNLKALQLSFFKKNMFVFLVPGHVLLRNIVDKLSQWGHSTSPQELPRWRNRGHVDRGQSFTEMLETDISAGTLECNKMIFIARRGWKMLCTW